MADKLVELAYEAGMGLAKGTADLLLAHYKSILIFRYKVNLRIRADNATYSSSSENRRGLDMFINGGLSELRATWRSLGFTPEELEDALDA